MEELKMETTTTTLYDNANKIERWEELKKEIKPLIKEAFGFKGDEKPNGKALLEWSQKHTEIANIEYELIGEDTPDLLRIKYIERQAQLLRLHREVGARLKRNDQWVLYTEKPIKGHDDLKAHAYLGYDKTKVDEFVIAGSAFYDKKGGNYILHKFSREYAIKNMEKNKKKEYKAFNLTTGEFIS